MGIRKRVESKIDRLAAYKLAVKLYGENAPKYIVAGLTAQLKNTNYANYKTEKEALLNEITANKIKGKKKILFNPNLRENSLMYLLAGMGN